MRAISACQSPPVCVVTCWAPGMQVAKDDPVHEMHVKDSKSCVAHVRVLPRSHSPADLKKDAQSAPAGGEPLALLPLAPQARSQGPPPATASLALLAQHVVTACLSRRHRADHGAFGSSSMYAQLPTLSCARHAHPLRILASSGSSVGMPCELGL